MEKDKRKMFTFNRNEGLIISDMVKNHIGYLAGQTPRNRLYIHEFIGLFDKLTPVMDLDAAIVKELREEVGK